MREKKIKLLVVEDDQELKEILIEFLSLDPVFDIESAIDGLDALQMLQKKEYDIIISDINMPRVNGFQLLEEVKKNGFGQPKFYFMSAHVISSPEMIKKLNVDGIFEKPFNFKNLAETLKKKFV